MGLPPKAHGRQIPDLLLADVELDTVPGPAAAIGTDADGRSQLVDRK